MSIQDKILQYKTWIIYASQGFAAVLLLGVLDPNTELLQSPAIEVSYVAVALLAVGAFLVGKSPAAKKLPVRSFPPQAAPRPQSKPVAAQIPTRKYNAAAEFYAGRPEPANVVAEDPTLKKNYTLPDISLGIPTFAESNKAREELDGQKQSFKEAAQKANAQLSRPPSIDDQFPR